MAERDIIQDLSKFLDSINQTFESVSDDISQFTDIQSTLGNILGVRESLKGIFDSINSPIFEFMNRLSTFREAGEVIDIEPIRAMEESLKEMNTLKNLYSRRFRPQQYFRLEIPEDFDEDIRNTIENQFNQNIKQLSEGFKKFRNTFTSLQELLQPREDYSDIIKEIRESLVKPEVLTESFEKIKSSLEDYMETLYEQSIEAEMAGDETKVQELNTQIETLTNYLENIDEEFGKKQKTYRNAYNIMNNIMSQVESGSTPLEALSRESGNIIRDVLQKGITAELEKNLRFFERFNIFDYQSMDISQIPQDIRTQIEGRIRKIMPDVSPERLENLTKLYYRYQQEMSNVINENVKNFVEQQEKTIQQLGLERVIEQYRQRGYTPIESYQQAVRNIPNLGQISEEVLNEVYSNSVVQLMQNFREIHSNISDISKTIGIDRPRFRNYATHFIDVQDIVGNLTSTLSQGPDIINGFIDEYRKNILTETQRNLNDVYNLYNRIHQEVRQNLPGDIGFEVTAETPIRDIINRLGDRFRRLDPTLQLKMVYGEDLENQIIQLETSTQFLKENLQSPRMLFRNILQESGDFLAQMQRFAGALTYHTGRFRPMMTVGAEPDIGPMGITPQLEPDFRNRFVREIGQLFRGGISPEYIEMVRSRLEKLHTLLDFDFQRSQMVSRVNDLKILYQTYNDVLDNISGDKSENFLRNLYNQLRERLQGPLREILPKEFRAPEFREFLQQFYLPELEGVNIGEVKENVQTFIKELDTFGKSLQTGRTPFTEQIRLFTTDFSRSIGQFMHFMGQMGGWMMGMPMMSGLWMVSYQPTTAAMQVTQPIMWGLAGLTGGSMFYQELMNFFYTIPQRMVQVQEQFITMTTLMRSRYAGRVAMEQAMEIARWQPIQFEEAIQTITAFTVFPETRGAIRTPTFQRQTIETVQLLSMLVPEQGIEGAIFAIRELLGNQFRSIERRFNISRELLASYAEVSVEEFKDLPGTEKLKALHKALSELFAGGEEILLQRGMMFDVQIRNFTDTLIRTIFPSITMEPNQIVRDMLTRLFTNIRPEGGLEVRSELLKNILGPVWEQYEELATRRVGPGATRPEIEREAFGMLMYHANTVSGMLSIMFSGIQNIFARVIEPLGVGERIGQFVSYVTEPFMARGGFLERWAGREITGDRFSEYMEDLINTIDQSIERFGNVVNRKDISSIFNRLALTVMEGMMTTMEAPLKTATIGGLKLTTMFPRIMGESFIESLGYMFRGGGSLLSPVDIAGTLLTLRGFTAFMMPGRSITQATTSLLQGLGIATLPGELREGNVFESLVSGLMIVSPMIPELARRIPLRRFIPMEIESEGFASYTRRILQRSFVQTALGISPIAISLLNAYRFRDDSGVLASNVANILSYSLAQGSRQAMEMMIGREAFARMPLAVRAGIPATIATLGLLPTIPLAQRFFTERTPETGMSFFGSLGAGLMSIGGVLLPSMPLAGGTLLAGGVLFNLLAPYIANVFRREESSPRTVAEYITYNYGGLLDEQQRSLGKELENFYKKYGLDMSKRLQELSKYFTGMGLNIEDVLSMSGIAYNLFNINVMRERYNKMMEQNVTNMFKYITSDSQVFQNIYYDENLRERYQRAVQAYQRRQFTSPDIIEFAKVTGFGSRFGIQSFEEYMYGASAEFVSGMLMYPKQQLLSTLRGLGRQREALPTPPEALTQFLEAGPYESEMMLTYRMEFQRELNNLNRYAQEALKNNLEPQLKIVNQLVNEFDYGRRLTGEDYSTLMNEIRESFPNLTKQQQSILANYGKSLLKMKGVLIESGLNEQDISQIMTFYESKELVPESQEKLQNIYNKLKEGGKFDEVYNRLYEFSKQVTLLTTKGLGDEIGQVLQMVQKIKPGEDISTVYNQISNMEGLSKTQKDDLKDLAKTYRDIQHFLTQRIGLKPEELDLLLTSTTTFGMENVNWYRESKQIIDKIYSRPYEMIRSMYFEEIKPPEPPKPPSPFEFAEQGTKMFAEQMAQFAQQAQQWLQPALQVASPRGLSSLLLIGSVAGNIGLTPTTGGSFANMAFNEWFGQNLFMMQNPELTLSNPLDILRNPMQYLMIGFMGYQAALQRGIPQAQAMSQFQEYISQMLNNVFGVTRQLQSFQSIGNISVASANITISSAHVNINA